MERLGTVDRFAQGLAIVQADERHAIGTTAIDEDLVTVGTVVDLFGPVDGPYVAVAPEDDVHLPSLLGSALYVR